MPEDPILVPPAVVDPTEAHPSEKPPLQYQRLASLEQVLNYQKRYTPRYIIVLRWLIENGVPDRIERIIREAANPGNPEQSYVNQTLNFIGPDGLVAGGYDVTLVLRDPLTALNEVAGILGFEVPSDLRFPEPAPPDGPAPCPFQEGPGGVDPKDPNCRFPDNDSRGYKVGDTWESAALGKWKLERAYSGFGPFGIYPRWRKVG